MSVGLGSVSPCTGLTPEPTPYDVRIRPLGQSPVIALTSADYGSKSSSAFYVSRLRVSGCISCTDPWTNLVPGAEWEWANGKRPDMIAVQEGGTRAS
jgi:hypothetical protein